MQFYFNETAFNSDHLIMRLLWVFASWKKRAFDWALVTKLKMSLYVQVTIIIIHWTHYLFTDWLKAYSEFSKSAPGTSSNCRLYNNHVKDTQGHK